MPAGRFDTGLQVYGRNSIGDVLPIGIASRRPGIIEISLPRPARASLVRIEPRSEAVLLHDLYELYHAGEIGWVRRLDLGPR